MNSSEVRKVLFIVSMSFLCLATPMARAQSWQPMASSTTNTLTSVWGSSASDVFAVGSGGVIVHYDGVSWSAMTSGTTQNLWGVGGTSASNVYAVGDYGTLLHYDGSAWSAVTSVTESTLYGISASAPDAIEAVGANAATLSYDGTNWLAGTITGVTWNMNSVCFNNPGSFIAVGALGTVYEHSGSTDTVTNPIAADLNGVWAVSGGTAAFAVGVNGAIVRQNAVGSWSSMASGITENLWAVWGSSENDIFAAGVAGNILHYDGSAWSPMTSNTINALYGIWGASGTDVFAVGDFGTILHYATDISTTTTTVDSTTTTIPAKPCLAQQVLGEDSTKLDTLRALRDSSLTQSFVGRRIIGIYYTNAESITAALERSPALRAVAVRVLEVITPAVGL